MRIFLLLFLLGTVSLSFGQSEDSLIVEAAADSVVFDEDEADTPPIYGASDTTQVQTRSFSESELQELKNDSDLEYKQPPTVAESLWSRFWRYLGELISSLFEGAVYTNWGQLITYLLAIVAFIAIILLILRIDAFKVLYSRESAAVQYSVLDENIHEMDFEKELQLAIDQRDYRRGVRLLFLNALKILSDRNYIVWEQGKTNHEYVSEVKEETLRNWLHQLSFYFDYAWYGNFIISREVFEKVNAIFTDWKGKVR